MSVSIAKQGSTETEHRELITNWRKHQNHMHNFEQSQLENRRTGNVYHPVSSCRISNKLTRLTDRDNSAPFTIRARVLHCKSRPGLHHDGENVKYYSEKHERSVHERFEENSPIPPSRQPTATPKERGDWSDKNTRKRYSNLKHNTRACMQKETRIW
jgi:hypothetical protein